MIAAVVAVVVVVVLNNSPTNENGSNNKRKKRREGGSERAREGGRERERDRARNRVFPPNSRFQTCAPTHTEWVRSSLSKDQAQERQPAYTTANPWLRLSPGVVGQVAQILVVPLKDSGEWMTGECTAYLQHILGSLAGVAPVNRIADYTVFLHDDAPRHLKPEFLSIIFRSLSLGTYNASFLNLAHERYVSALTPCLSHLYKTVMGRELVGRLSTYCCGHFVVKSSRIHEIPVEPLQRLLAAVQSGAYTAKAGGPCEARACFCFGLQPAVKDAVGALGACRGQKKHEDKDR